MKQIQGNKGEVGFGTEIIIFLVILFIIWVLAGKPEQNADKPFIKQNNIQVR